MATGGRPVAFYQRCGFDLVEVVALPNWEPLTILSAIPSAIPTAIPTALAVQ